MLTSIRSRCAVAAILIPALWSAALPTAHGDALSTDQKAELNALIRAYILENPDVIVESLQRMQAREQEATERRQAAQVAALVEVIERDPNDPVIGNPEGDVTLVEFFDYQCGYCKRMIGPLIDAARRDGGLRIVMKEYPILGPASVTAAYAALASRNQNRYEAFHIALMELRGQLSDEAIFQTAREVGLDVDRLQRDMQAPDIATHVENVKALASALSVSGTPAFIIDGMLIPGAISADQLQGLVDSARAGG